MAFAIITDTSANLPSEWLEEKQVAVLPFSYLYRGAVCSCLDTRAFDGKAYYAALRAGEKVSTSQITPNDYIECFEPLLRQGQDVLFVSMSSGISGSCASGQSAAAQLMERYPQRKVRIADTLAASLGEGIYVMHALSCRERGMDIDETLAYLSQRVKKMYQIFTVDDLMHLRRTGRLSNATALLGTVLGVKPLLKGNEKGQIVSCGMVRGRKAAVRALAAKYDALVRNASEQVVGIAHADCPEDAAYLAELLRKNHPPKEILTVLYEPVTGSHVGPATLALFFEGDDNVRAK